MEIIIIGIAIGKAKIASRVALFEIMLKLEHKQEIAEIEIDENINSEAFLAI